MATTRHVESTVDSRGRSREVEVFVFNNPAKRKKAEKSEAKMPQQQQQQTHAVMSRRKMLEVNTIDLEAARREVQKVGISAFSGQTKIEAQLAQLKRLGAEIPKNWQRKMDKKKRHQEFRRIRQDLKAGIQRKQSANPNKSVQRSQAEKTKKKKEKEGVFFDGKIGKYKDGVQFISSADIQRVRKSTSKRKQ